MLAVVKKPHTKNPLFEVKGEIPSELLKYLHETFGNDVEVIAEEDQITDIFASSWFQNISESTSPGETVKIYRENLKLTQEELGKKIGKFTRQNISDIELGRRSISKDVAKKFSALFHVSVERFI